MVTLIPKNVALYTDEFTDTSMVYIIHNWRLRCKGIRVHAWYIVKIFGGIVLLIIKEYKRYCWL